MFYMANDTDEEKKAQNGKNKKKVIDFLFICQLISNQMEEEKHLHVYTDELVRISKHSQKKKNDTKFSLCVESQKNYGNS